MAMKTTETDNINLDNFKKLNKMEILREYISENEHLKEIHFSKFVNSKLKTIVKYLVAEFEDKRNVERKNVEDLMNRIFQSFKKKNTRLQIKFVSDKLSVDWNILLDALNTARVKESEFEVKRLINKRRKLHLDLHIEANNQEGASSSHIQNGDVFSSGEPFDIISIKNQIKIWRENASRIDQLAKQDLLFYNILDFTNKSQKSALKCTMKEHYTILKHYINKFHLRNIDIKTAIKVEEIEKLMEEQFKDETNTFTDITINERHFIMCFVYPLIQILFSDISKKTITQRWGEAKLVCSKEEENQALETDARRASGSNIDAIIGLKQMNRLKFIIIEVSGGPTGNNHEHYLEDKNKIGKNLKKMLKAIISLRLDKTSLVSRVKLYGIHIYNNEIHLYSVFSPMNNMYVFNEELVVKIPIMHALLNSRLQPFVQKLNEIKGLLLLSFESVQYFIMSEVEVEDDEESVSAASSPYVSPQKGKRKA